MNDNHAKNILGTELQSCCLDPMTGYFRDGFCEELSVGRPLEKEIGSHALGYISEISQQQIPTYRERDNYHYRLGDFIGQAGIEKNFDLDLRGTDGYQFMEVDARGRMKRLIKGKLNNISKGKIKADYLMSFYSK